MHWYYFVQRRNCGGGAGGAPPSFHTLAKDISLDRSVTLIALGLRPMYYLILPIINIPAPPSQNYPVASLIMCTLFYRITFSFMNYLEHTVGNQQVSCKTYRFHQTMGPVLRTNLYFSAVKILNVYIHIICVVKFKSIAVK